MLKDNFEEVEKKIQAACDRSGRRREDITLIAVSKTKPVDMLKEAYDFGTRIFGENKVQEITEKYDALPRDISWHMIGHLQRNKVKYIIDKVDYIHSVDSVRLAETIEKEAAKHNLTVKILVEVNVAGEESKFGLSPEEVLPFIEAYTSEHANSTETTTLVDQEKIGQMRFYNNPIRFNDELCPIWRGAPLLGEDSREILAGLGYSEEKIDQLFADGVVGSSMI